MIQKIALIFSDKLAQETTKSKRRKKLNYSLQTYCVYACNAYNEDKGKI